MKKPSRLFEEELPLDAMAYSTLDGRKDSRRKMLLSIKLRVEKMKSTLQKDLTELSQLVTVVEKELEVDRTSLRRQDAATNPPVATLDALPKGLRRWKGRRGREDPYVVENGERVGGRWSGASPASSPLPLTRAQIHYRDSTVYSMEPRITGLLEAIDNEEGRRFCHTVMLMSSRITAFLHRMNTYDLYVGYVTPTLRFMMENIFDDDCEEWIWEHGEAMREMTPMDSGDTTPLMDERPFAQVDGPSDEWSEYADSGHCRVYTTGTPEGPVEMMLCNDYMMHDLMKKRGLSLDEILSSEKRGGCGICPAIPPPIVPRSTKEVNFLDAVKREGKVFGRPWREYGHLPRFDV